MVCSPLLPRLRSLLALLLVGLATSAAVPAQELVELLAQPWRWRELAPPTGTRSHDLVALHPDGRLFSSSGSHVSVFDGTRWSLFGSAREPIAALFPSGPGLLILSRLGTCSYLDQDGLHATVVPRVAGQFPRAFLLGEDDLVVKTIEHYYRFRGGRGERLDLPPLAGTDALGRTASGALLAIAKGRAWLERASEWVELSLPVQAESPATYGRILSYEGDLWLFPGAYSYGLPLLRFTGERFETVAEPTRSELAVTVPGHGFLSWHADRGAHTFSAETWRPVVRIPGTQGQIPDYAFCDTEHLFVQMASGRLWSVDLLSERWVRVQPPPPHAKAQGQALSTSQRGGLWLGSSEGLLRWDGGEFVEHHREALGVPLEFLTAAYEDPSGDVWVGSGSSFVGVFKLSGETWERVESPVSDYHVHHIEQDAAGNLWFMLLSTADDPAGPAGGVARFDGREWRRFTVEDGLPSNRCYDVQLTASGELLVGTGRGIARLEDDRWIHEPAYGQLPARLLFQSSRGPLWVTAGIRLPGVRAFRNGLPLALPDPAMERLMVGAMSESPGRGLWFSTRQGLFLLDELELFHELTQEFGVPARTFWPMLQQPDSTLLLGSLEGGIVRFQPDDSTPPVVLELAVATGEHEHSRATWLGSDPWSVTPSSELRYRWRLEPDLADGTGRSSWSPLLRVPSVPLGVLPHGTHRLEVEALDLQGNRSAQPARLEFSIPAPFWARPGVLLGLAAIALLILGLAGFSLRQWRTARRQERLESSRVADSERHYRTLVERVRVLIASFDHAGQLTYVSPGLARLVGVAPQQVTTALLLERLAPEDNPEGAVLRSSLLGSRTGEWMGELPVQTLGGAPAWLYAILSPAEPHDAGGQSGWDFAAVDLTARKAGERRERELATQLTRARRLEAIGRLSAGIGHDFNNLLTAISGNVAVVAEHLDEPALQPLRSNLSEIELAATQAQALTRRLLSFGREQSTELKRLDLDATLSAARPIVQRLIHEDVHLSFEAGDAGVIECGEGQIERVLFNLVLNAQDAMPEGGELVVRTRRVSLDAEQAREHAPLAAGDYAVLSVEDHGEGMDPATLERACEPFFTTKEAGRGTGLGLATVHGIAAQGGGRIEISSALGKGTTVDAYFPLASTAAGAGVQRSTFFAGAEGGEHRKTLLFCEDDASVRSFISQCLEEYGFEVLVAEGPEQALELSAHHAGPIDLLLTDVVMPVMNGFQLAEQLSEPRPDMRVLYVSGYSADLLPKHAPAQIHLLQKPFRPDTLLARVHEVLDELAGPPAIPR